MSFKNLSLSELITYCKGYGFIFQSSEIYDGIQAIYDYGHYGCLLKQNVKRLWQQEMIQKHNNIVGIDSAIIMHPNIWKASGHVDNFDDLMIDNKDSKKRYRVDVLIEEFAEKHKKPGIVDLMNNYIKDENLDGLYDIIVNNNICCPVSGTCNWTPVRHFNLMFNFKDIDDNTIYLRPETAQGIYVNFLNIQRSTRQKLPFGIAQIGKAFRNEIIARQFTFRMREFEQMEMQFFIRPGEDEHWFEEWKTQRLYWYTEVLKIPQEKLRIKPHAKLSHYATAAVDIEYKFPFGFKEIEGIHARGDFDLSNHTKSSGTKMTYVDPETKEPFIPHVIETSCGCDRIILMLLSEFVSKQTTAEKERFVFSIDKTLSPIKCAILPLMKKTELMDVADKIYDVLKSDVMCSYDVSGSIGKRYAYNDIIGTPCCVTVDYQTLEDDTVTLRSRDTMLQQRVKRCDIINFL